MAPKLRLLPEIEEKIIADYLRGDSGKTVGQRYGFSLITVQRLFKKRGMNLRKIGEYWRGKKCGSVIKPKRIPLTEAEIKAKEKKHGKYWYQRYKDAKPGYHALSAIRQRARNKGIPFDITIDDVVYPEFCPVLGVRLERNTGRYGPKDSSPTIDRIIPELGYVKGNIRVISDKANRIKTNATVKEVELVLAYMRRCADEMEIENISLVEALCP